MGSSGAPGCSGRGPPPARHRGAAPGEPLSEAQRAALAQESTPGASGSELVPAVLARIDQALEQLRHTAVESLHAGREVGRARLPSTVLGLLFHAAEHTSRHAGQLITTLKIVRGLRSRGDGAP